MSFCGTRMRATLGLCSFASSRYPVHSGRRPQPLSSVTPPCLSPKLWVRVFVLASNVCSIFFSVYRHHIQTNVLSQHIRSHSLRLLFLHAHRETTRYFEILDDEQAQPTCNTARVTYAAFFKFHVEQALRGSLPICCLCSPLPPPHNLC